MFLITRLQSKGFVLKLISHCVIQLSRLRISGVFVLTRLVKPVLTLGSHPQLQRPASPRMRPRDLLAAPRAGPSLPGLGGLLQAPRRLDPAVPPQGWETPRRGPARGRSRTRPPQHPPVRAAGTKAVTPSTAPAGVLPPGCPRAPCQPPSDRPSGCIARSFQPRVDQPSRSCPASR